MVYKERSIASWGGEQEPGDSITGKIIRTEPNVNAKDGELNPLFDYILLTEKGEVRVWGSKMLNLQLLKADAGKNVKIEFAGFGKAQKGKNAPKQWRVQVDE